MAQADHVPTPSREPNPDANATRSTSLRPIRTKPHDRRYFIGGSDARIIMGDNEAALLRLWREKRGRSRAGGPFGQPPHTARPGH